MKIKQLPLVLSLLAVFPALSLKAQDTGKYPKHRLTHEMSAEEAQKSYLIGRDFVETDPPSGVIHNLGEFERAKGVLVAYPFGIPLTLIREMARDAEVTTLVSGAAQENTVRNQYTNAGVNLDHCNFIYASTDSYWTRDYGPWFITYGENQVGIVDFPYNRPRPNDDEVPKEVAAAMGIPWFGMNVIHTGGNYMSGSYGDASSTTLVYTENPGQTSSQIAVKMNNYLGVSNYIVVEDPNNTYIDHIDCWGKFLATDKILIRSVPATHPQYNEIEATAAYYAAQTSPWGDLYKVYRVYTPDNEPYTNSFIFNNKVFVPVTGSQNDQAALSTYRQAMPGYQVFGITALPGAPWESTDALHCRTHELADPEMLRIMHYPLLGNAPAAGSFTFAANITAYSGAAVIADSVLLYYRVNPNPYTPFTALPMTNFSGNSWTLTIPAPEYGSTVQYYIHAADASGRSENHPFIGAADPHEFYVGTRLFAQAETDVNQLSLTAMQDLTDQQSFNLTNTGELSLNYYLSFSTAIYDTITLHPGNSPAAYAYNSNTYTENGWTDLNVAESGQMSGLIVSYTWNTDNYASEGSLWAESPSGTMVMLASGQQDGVYTVSSSAFAGEPLQGNWKLWIEDSYGDGGHQATNVTVKFVRASDTGNWLSADPAEGTIEPGSTQEIQVTCDAGGLALGTYQGKITILSNDPDQPEQSIPVIFEVTVNTGTSLQSDEPLAIRAFPNPVDEELILEMTAAAHSYAAITLTDATGRTLLNRRDLEIVAGSKRVVLKTGNLLPGIYLLQVQSPEQVKMVKIVKK